MSNSAFDPKKPGKRHNYELKSDAVETLAGADSEEVPQYSEEELGKYRSRKYFHIPDAVKILFINAWFGGVVCYFILWGLGVYLPNTIDMLFVLGVVLGMVTDLLTNNILRFIETVPGENDKWLLVTHKGMIGFGLNLLMSMVIVICVFFLYYFINRFVVSITSDPNNLFLGVEPVLYGLFCMGFDMLFIGVKRLCKAIWRDAVAAARGESGKGKSDD